MYKQHTASILASLAIGLIFCFTFTRSIPMASQISRTVSSSSEHELKDMAFLRHSHKWAPLIHDPPPDVSVRGRVCLGYFEVENESEHKVWVKYVIDGITKIAAVAAGAHQYLAEHLRTNSLVSASAQLQPYQENISRNLAILRVAEGAARERAPERQDHEHDCDSSSISEGHYVESDIGEHDDWADDNNADLDTDGHIQFSDDTDDDLGEGQDFRASCDQRLQM